MTLLDPTKEVRGALLRIALFAALTLALLGGVFAKGCSYGKGVGKRENAPLIVEKDKALTKAYGDLKDAERSLRAAGVALDAQNQANAQALAAAEKAAAEAKATGQVAAAELAKAQKRIAALDARYEKARRNPDCDALLNADLAKVCGL